MAHQCLLLEDRLCHGILLHAYLLLSLVVYVRTHELQVFEPSVRFLLIAMVCTRSHCTQRPLGPCMPVCPGSMSDSYVDRPCRYLKTPAMIEDLQISVSRGMIKIVVFLSSSTHRCEASRYSQESGATWKLSRMDEPRLHSRSLQSSVVLCFE